MFSLMNIEEKNIVSRPCCSVSSREEGMSVLLPELRE